MTKRAVGVLGVLVVGGALCTAVALRGLGAHGVKREFSRSMVRRAWQELHRSILPAASAASSSSQDIVPRDPDFLQPQRLDSWQIIGPGGGGTFYFPAISPHDSNLVFATTDMTGCYVSENGGHTWRTFNLRAPCKVVFDPKLPNRVYAMALGLWRSDDRGHTWSMIFPDASAKVEYLNDEAEPLLHTLSGYPQPVSALAIDPDDNNTLYASMGEEKLQISKDAGKTWSILASDAYAEQIWVDPTSPRDKRTVYTRRSTQIGTWDGTRYVKRVVDGVAGIAAAAFGTPSGGGKPVIYIACDYVLKDGQQPGGGIKASDDGGQTWRSLNDNILKLVAKNTYPNFTTIAASRKHAEVLYASFENFTSPDDQKSYYGVLKSSDGGATWTSVRQESSLIAANMHNDWTSSRFGPDFGDQPLGMEVDDNNPDLVYGSDLARIMRSVDGGKNWVGVNSQSTGNGYTTTGLDVTTCYGLHFDPFDPKRMFISYTDIGLMRSEDGGDSWLSATTNGIPRGWWNTTYWVEFDPEVKGKMWAVMSSRHDLPRHRMLNLYGGGAGGVALSVDGGITWKVASNGLPSTVVPTHILVDPKSSAEARVLYIAAFGTGVFKSTDGGQNWVPKNTGLPETNPLTWRMAIGSDGTLYVVTIRRSEDGKYGNEQDGWLFRSRNGADSWERVALPEGVNGPTGITVDPRDPARLYLSVWARYTAGAAGVAPPDGGVYMSVDGGQHWRNVLNASRRIYDVTVDPRNSDLVYAVGFEASAWRSTDRGRTWRRLGGFNFKDGHRAIPDPADINKIYITTFGNSVWHGPAAGEAKAPEDILGPPTMKFQYAVQNAGR